MQTVEIHAAEADLARLVDAAEAGEEIVLARGGKPVAKIVAIGTGSVRLRVLGRLAGRLNVPDDFDAPLPDEVMDGSEGR